MQESIRIPIEQWKAQKNAVREQVAAAQKDAMRKATSNGKAVLEYMVGRGRLGSQLSSGNSALVLATMPQARVVMSFEAWSEYGRHINKGATGISVLSRKNGYTVVEKVYELAQTHGNRPYTLPELGNDPSHLKKALNALVQNAPVDVVTGENILGPVCYDSQRNTIMVSRTVCDVDLFRLLPREIVIASMEKETPGASNRSDTMFYGECVAAELCGRFGILPDSAAEARLNQLCKCISPGNERAALDYARSYARSLGNEVQRAILPNVQQRAEPKRESR